MKHLVLLLELTDEETQLRDMGVLSWVTQEVMVEAGGIQPQVESSPLRGSWAVKSHPTIASGAGGCAWSG